MFNHIFHIIVKKNVFWAVCKMMIIGTKLHENKIATHYQSIYDVAILFCWNSHWIKYSCIITIIRLQERTNWYVDFWDYSQIFLAWLPSSTTCCAVFEAHYPQILSFQTAKKLIFVLRTFYISWQTIPAQHIWYSLFEISMVKYGVPFWRYTQYLPRNPCANF